MAPRPKQEDGSEGKPTETLDGRYSEYLSMNCICINVYQNLNKTCFNEVPLFFFYVFS